MQADLVGEDQQPDQVRPEFDKALALAHDIKQATPDQPVIRTVYELKRPARNAAELMALAATLEAGGIQLDPADPARHG